MSRTAADLVLELTTNIAELARERDALGEAAFAAYVASGGDTDGAATWREFFRPIVSPSWAQVVRDAVTEAIDDAS